MTKEIKKQQQHLENTSIDQKPNVVIQQTITTVEETITTKEENNNNNNGELEIKCIKKKF